MQRTLLVAVAAGMLLAGCVWGAGQAARYDSEERIKLLEKAIAERQKDPDSTAAPVLDDLRWTYTLTLGEAGRREDALKVAGAVLEKAEKDLAAIEALPGDDPQRRRLSGLRLTLTGRLQTAARMLTDFAEYQKALDYLDKCVRTYGDNVLEGRAAIELIRAAIYSRMAKPDLELESYARAFASRMDIATRDRIRDSAGRYGRKPEDVFELARRVRKGNAVPVAAFQLKTVDGSTVTLDSFKSKVILIEFFFPT